MSDSVTNVEIEDVLSSIRRLVSDGDKARTRDSAPAEDVLQLTPETADNTVDAPESKPAKFVLTPAFMVVESDTAPELEQDNAAAVENSDEGAHADDDMQADAATDDHHVDDDQEDDDQDAGWVEELPDEPDAIHDDHDDPEASSETMSDFATDEFEADESFDSALQDDAITIDEAVRDVDQDNDAEDMVWGSVEEARKAGLAAVPEYEGLKSHTGKTADRSGLIASIAELEAAISKNVQDFEPDGSEVSDEMLGEAIAWPSIPKRNVENVQDVEDAVQADDAPLAEDQQADDPLEDAHSIEFEHRAPDHEETTQGSPVEQLDAQDDYDDDDLDGLTDTVAANLDDDALRALVSEIVREELAGPMGERITRNVRKLVRREIYRILSSQEFD
ncbi:MAG: hypothetical protein ACSHWY_09855 [Octadecabacter sp.]